MTDDPRGSATDEMVEATIGVLKRHGYYIHPSGAAKVAVHEALSAALALDPLRQPVAGDVIAVAMDAFNSTTDFGEAIERVIAADRARGFAGNDALSHYESGVVHQTIGAPSVAITDETVAEALDAWREREFAEMAVMKWRRPAGFLMGRTNEPHRRILILSPDLEILAHWTGAGVLPVGTLAWAEMPAPPAWATQSPERWSGDAPRDADDDRLSPNESFMAMRALRDRRPQHDFTPAEWRAWEVEKGVLLERVWRSANAHETPGVAALAGGDDDYAFERDDYGGLAAAIRACCNRNDYVALRAVLSNNLNVILSALTDRADPVRKESLPTEPPFPRWSAELAHALRELLLDRETNKGELFSVRCAWEELRKAAFPETSDAG